MTLSRPRLLLATGLLGTALLATLDAQTAPGRRPASVPTGSVPLTVDSIMRGAALVGHPPARLRRAGDSARLSFQWRGRDNISAS